MRKDIQDRPPGILVNDREALMPRSAFDLLRDYSCSVPTGQTIGKRWKCRIDYYDESKGWRMGEYAGANRPDEVLIVWRSLIVADAIETRHFDGSQCFKCGWWHVPGLRVVGQPEPHDYSTSCCPSCGARFLAGDVTPFFSLKLARPRPRVVWWRPSTWWPGPWRRVTE